MEDDYNNNTIDSYIDRLEEFSKSLDLELENELLDDDGIDQTEFTIIDDDKSDDEDDLHINHDDLNSSFSLVDKSFLKKSNPSAAHDNSDSHSDSDSDNNNDNTNDNNSSSNAVKPFNPSFSSFPSSPIPKEESDDEYECPTTTTAAVVKSEKDFNLEERSEMNVI